MKNFFLSGIILLGVLCLGCEDEDTGDKLTPITNTGDGGFSCKINGEVWKRNIEGIFHMGLPYTYAIWQKDTMQIYARRKSAKKIHIDSETEIIFHLPNISKTGTFALNGSQDYAEYGIYNDSLNYPHHISYLRTDDNYGGSIMITTLDTNKHIVAGTFSFKIKKPDGTILNFTDGRFDLYLSH